MFGFGLRFFRRDGKNKFKTILKTIFFKLLERQNKRRNVFFKLITQQRGWVRGGGRL